MSANAWCLCMSLGSLEILFGDLPNTSVLLAQPKPCSNNLSGYTPLE